MLKIALESLGCSKNLVDAEIMMGILNEKGYKLTGNFEEADVILVNTCGFIESAKQESIQTILEFAELKETANLKLLIVTGCLAQRYADELKEEIECPECHNKIELDWDGEDDDCCSGGCCGCGHHDECGSDEEDSDTDNEEKDDNDDDM